MWYASCRLFVEATFLQGERALTGDSFVKTHPLKRMTSYPLNLVPDPLPPAAAASTADEPTATGTLQYDYTQPVVGGPQLPPQALGQGVAESSRLQVGLESTGGSGFGERGGRYGEQGGVAHPFDNVMSPTGSILSNTSTARGRNDLSYNSYDVGYPPTASTGTRNENVEGRMVELNSKESGEGGRAEEGGGVGEIPGKTDKVSSQRERGNRDHADKVIVTDRAVRNAGK